MFPSIPHAGKIKIPNRSTIFMEKVDGSQLSVVRSTVVTFYCKGNAIKRDNPVFSKAITVIEQMAHRLRPGVHYHGEAVCKNRQNSITYEAVPPCYWVIFDIKDSSGFWNCDEVASECERIGVLPVQILLRDPVDVGADSARIMRQIETGELQSMLGGRMEGIVIKHYGERSTPRVKMVREDFKEFNRQKKPKGRALGVAGTLTWIGSHFACAPRRAKARQHLDNNGIAEPTEDQLSAELDADLIKEHLDLIKCYLWAEFGNGILKKAAQQTPPAAPWRDMPTTTCEEVLEWLSAVVAQGIDDPRSVLTDTLWDLFRDPILAALRS